MTPRPSAKASWTRSGRRPGPAVASQENERPSPSHVESKLSHTPTLIRPDRRSRTPRLNGAPAAMAWRK